MAERLPRSANSSQTTRSSFMAASGYTSNAKFMASPYSNGLSLLSAWRAGLGICQSSVLSPRTIWACFDGPVFIPAGDFFASPARPASLGRIECGEGINKFLHVKFRDDAALATQTQVCTMSDCLGRLDHGPLFIGHHPSLSGSRRRCNGGGRRTNLPGLPKFCLVHRGTLEWLFVYQPPPPRKTRLRRGRW